MTVLQTDRTDFICILPARDSGCLCLCGLQVKEKHNIIKSSVDFVERMLFTHSSGHRCKEEISQRNEVSGKRQPNSVQPPLAHCILICCVVHLLYVLLFSFTYLCVYAVRQRNNPSTLNVGRTDAEAAAALIKKILQL